MHLIRILGNKSFHADRFAACELVVKRIILRYDIGETI